MDLGDLRTQIDAVDEQIVDLYERRMDICRQVAEVKIETGKKVFDRDREKEKIAKVKSLTHTDFNKTGIGELFEQIMSMSRKLQYQLLTEKGDDREPAFYRRGFLRGRPGARRVPGRGGSLLPGSHASVFRGCG